MTSIIKVENLSKKYLIGHQKNESYTALRDVMMHKLRGIRERIKHPLSPNREEIDIEEFWALKNINLKIKEGERVGIIGRNGAGKSTLLKVLSRITEPTKGRITIGGRVASLLEVGTGFHPELTGRENIFLNGAILGMRKAEIRKKFDEIVAFAEIEKFLDTPVKRYSSGMYVRLAFAVAAHMEQEILIVDEVLAVGDAAFQKKCLGKMGDVAEDGRTILFVSHNMGAIQQLTRKSLLLEAGEAVMFDDTPKAVETYLKKKNSIADHASLKTNVSDFKINFLRSSKDSSSGFNKPLIFDLSLLLKKSRSDMTFALGVYNSIGARLLTSRCLIDEIKKGEPNLSIIIKDHHLPPGNYMLSLGVSAHSVMLIYKENVLAFEISDLGVDEPCLVPYLLNHRDQIGAFIPSEWKIS